MHLMLVITYLGFQTQSKLMMFKLSRKKEGGRAGETDRGTEEERAAGTGLAGETEQGIMYGLTGERARKSGGMYERETGEEKAVRPASETAGDREQARTRETERVESLARGRAGWGAKE